MFDYYIGPDGKPVKKADVENAAREANLPLTDYIFLNNFTEAQEDEQGDNTIHPISHSVTTNKTTDQYGNVITNTFKSELDVAEPEVYTGPVENVDADEFENLINSRSSLQNISQGTSEEFQELDYDPSETGYIDYNGVRYKNVDPNFFDKKKLFDVFEEEFDEDEILSEDGRPVQDVREDPIVSFFEQEEEAAREILKQYFPSFDISYENIYGSLEKGADRGFEETPGGFFYTTSADALRIKHPDDPGNGIIIELDITDQFLTSTSRAKSKRDFNYKRLQDYIMKYVGDADAELEKRNLSLETAIVPGTERKSEASTIPGTKIKDVYNLPVDKGGVNLSEAQINQINDKFKYNSTTGEFDLSIFDIQKRTGYTGGYASPTTGIATGTGSYEYDFKPYEFELNQMRKYYEEYQKEVGVDKFTFTEDDIKLAVAKDLRAKEIIAQKEYNLEQFIEDDEVLQGLMSAYTLNISDAEVKEAVKASTKTELAVDNLMALNNHIEAFSSWYHDPSATWDINWEEDEQKLVTLENGKVIPVDDYMTFLHALKQFDEEQTRAKELFKISNDAKDKVSDRQAQWDLLRRDYDILSKAGNNILLGTADIVVGGAYMIHKLNKFVPTPVAGISWAIDDDVDEAVADYYGWSQQTRDAFRRDVKFEDAFSDGNFGRFFVDEISKQIPIIASIIIAGPSSAMYVVGTYSAGQEFMRLEHSDRYLGAQHSEFEKYMRSIGYGTAEGVLGTMPTVWILGKGNNMLKDVAKGGLKDWWKNPGKEFFKRNAPAGVIYGPAIEAGSEGATGIVQNSISIAADWMADRPNNMTIFDGFLHQAFVGGMVGLSLSGSQYAYGQYIAAFDTKENINEVLSKQSRLRDLNNTYDKMDKRTKPALDNRKEAEKLQTEINDIIESAAARLNYIDRPGFLGYREATKRQGEIYSEVEAITKDNTLSDIKKKELIEKKKADFDALAKIRNDFRNEKSFGDSFYVYEVNDKEGYNKLKSKAEANLRNEGKDFKDPKVLEKEMKNLYIEMQVDEANTKSEEANNNLGKKFEVVSTAKKMADIIQGKIDEINNKEELTKEDKDRVKNLLNAKENILSGRANGFYDPVTKEKYNVRENQIKNGKPFVGTHETGHDVWEDMFVNDPEFAEDFAKQIKDYLFMTNKDLYNRLNNQGIFNKTAEEQVMEFFEEVARGAIDPNAENMPYLAPLLGFITNDKSGDKIDFKSKEDVVAWLSGLASKIADGTISKQDLLEAKKIADEARKQKKDGTVKTEKDTKIKESTSNNIQSIYDEQGPKDGAFSILNEYEGMANKLANKYQNVPGFDRQLLVDEILTGKRGIYDLIQAYNPKSGVPLAAYINKYVGARSIEAANRILKTNFEQDVTEARGIAAQEKVEVNLDNQKQRNSKLRRQLNIPNAVVTKIKEAVEKTFGTRLPDVNSKDFKKALQDNFRTELFKVIKNTMGTRTKFRNYLDKNFEAIYKALPQSTINKRFKPFAEPVLDENGKQKREKTAQGNAIFKKKNITKEEFINYFLGDNVGNSTKGTRKDALAEALAEELAFDATMEIVQSPEVMQRRAMIAELDGKELMDNDISVIARQIDRDPSIKFSEISVPKGVDPTDYVKNQFIPQGNKLYDLVQDKGYDHVYIENADLYKASYNNDVWNFVDNAYINGKIEDGNNTTWKQWLENSNVPQEIKDIIKERGRLTNNSKKTHLDHYFNNISKLAKKLGKDVMDLFGKDMEVLGFVYRLLDPAQNKQDGTQGKYYNKKEKLKNSLKPSVNLPFDVNDVSLMNIKFPLFKKLQKILDQNTGAKSKIDQILSDQKLVDEINAANTANIDLSVFIAMNMATSDMDMLSILDMLQAQSNIVGGMKGASRLDYLQPLDGPQGTKDVKSHPKYDEVKKYLEELNKKLKPENRKTPAQIESAVKTILKPKGEHVGAWLKTAQAIADAIVDFRYGPNKGDVNVLETALYKAHKNHTQYLTDIFDTKIIDRIQLDSDGNILISGRTTDKTVSRLQGTKAVGILGESVIERQAKLVAENELKIKFSESNYDTYKNVSGKLDLITKVRAIASNPNQPQKGISVLDFDDTLAKTNSKIIVNMPDGSVREINATEFATQSEFLEREGATFDFKQFNEVVDGKKGPFFNKAKSLRDKFGNTDIFVLTARPQAAANAIHKFLKGIGLEIPLANITGLENGSPQAKADWILEKAAEGYNDFLFADDAIKNVKAVKSVLDAVDIKSKVYQAGQKNAKGQPNLKFSKSDQFNKILEDKKGVSAKARYSDAVAKLKGSRVGKFQFYLPPSAQDFALLLYNFLPKGKLGNQAWQFLHENLIKPYNSGIAALDIARQQIHIDYKNLLNEFKNIKKNLNKEIPNSSFTYQQAVRIYLWSKNGIKIPGLAKRDLKAVADIIKADPELKAFADKLSKITNLPDGYTQPSEVWVVESILSDLHSITDKVGRKQFLKEFNDNVDEIFSKDNLNKIEALFGTSLVDALKDVLYRMKNGTNRQQGSSKQMNQFMNWINNSVGATMFINLRSATLQSLSTFNYINYSDNNIFKAAAAFANFPNYIKHVVKIFNSPKLKQRRSGLRLNVQEAEMAEAANKGGFNGMLAYLLKIGFTPTRAVDSLAIATGGATFLINRTKTYLKKGMSKAEAEARAFEDFAEITEKNQQSADPSKISPIQAGPLGRVIFAWQNTPFQYNRVMKMAYLDLVNRRITPPYKTQIESDISNVGKIIYYGALQNLIFNAMQTGLFALLFDEDDLPDDEKQQKKEEGQYVRTINQMVDTILRGSGLPGAIVSTMKNVIMKYREQEGKDWGTDHTYTLIEALNLSPTIGSKARLMYSGIQTKRFENDVIEARGLAYDSPVWEVIAAEVQALTNVPMSKALLLLRNAQGTLQERHAAWQRIAMGMGWPYYQFNVDLYPDHEQIKADAKAKRKQEGIEKAKVTRAQNKEIREQAEAYIMMNMGIMEQIEYNNLNRKEQKAWLKKKVEEYLNK